MQQRIGGCDRIRDVVEMLKGFSSLQRFTNLLFGLASITGIRGEERLDRSQNALTIVGSLRKHRGDAPLRFVSPSHVLKRERRLKHPERRIEALRIANHRK